MAASTFKHVEVSSNTVKFANLNCKVCLKSVKNGIMCVKCELWIHNKCAGTNTKNIKNVDSWSCLDCHRSEALNIIKTKEEIIRILNNDIVILKGEIDELKKINEQSTSDASETHYSNTSKQHNLDRVGFKSKKCNEFSSREKQSSKNDSLSQSTVYGMPVSNRFSVLCESSDEDDYFLGFSDHTSESTNNNIEYLTDSERIEVSSQKKSSQNVLKGKETRSSRKKTPVNMRNIKLFADSHGRNITLQTGRDLNCSFQSIIKPGAKFESVTSDCIRECDNFNSNDCVIIMAGSNDVACNESRNLLRSLKKKLAELRHTNVMLVNLPHCYDLPNWSIVNLEIDKVNVGLGKLAKFFPKLTIIDVSKLGRRFHTSHGRHLNILGKRILSDTIINSIENLPSVNTQKPIALSNKGN
jgi:hypothetical protein